jgi:hypothetical protein
LLSRRIRRRFTAFNRIVANETADPRTSDQARSTDGWHF